MIELIINVIGALSDKQADVIIAVLGLISAFIVAGLGLFGSVLTFALNKRSERKIELRKIKEAQYIEFLGSLAEAKAADNSEKHKINMCLSSRIQTIYLVGNKNVQNALHGFLNYFTNKAEEPNKSIEKDKCNKPEKTKGQDELYAELIKAMKKDLYGKTESSIESISYTIFID